MVEPVLLPGDIPCTGCKPGPSHVQVPDDYDPFNGRFDESDFADFQGKPENEKYSMASYENIKCHATRLEETKQISKNGVPIKRIPWPHKETESIFKRLETAYTNPERYAYPKVPSHRHNISTRLIPQSPFEVYEIIVDGYERADQLHRYCFVKIRKIMSHKFGPDWHQQYYAKAKLIPITPAGPPEPSADAKKNDQDCPKALPFTLAAITIVKKFMKNKLTTGCKTKELNKWKGDTAMANWYGILTMDYTSPITVFYNLDEPADNVNDGIEDEHHERLNGCQRRSHSEIRASKEAEYLDRKALQRPRSKEAEVLKKTHRELKALYCKQRVTFPDDKYVVQCYQFFRKFFEGTYDEFLHLPWARRELIKFGDEALKGNYVHSSPFCDIPQAHNFDTVTIDGIHQSKGKVVDPIGFGAKFQGTFFESLRDMFFYREKFYFPKLPPNENPKHFLLLNTYKNIVERHLFRQTMLDILFKAILTRHQKIRRHYPWLKKMLSFLSRVYFIYRDPMLFNPMTIYNFFKGCFKGLPKPPRRVNLDEKEQMALRGYIEKFTHPDALPPHYFEKLDPQQRPWTHKDGTTLSTVGLEGIAPPAKWRRTGIPCGYHNGTQFVYFHAENHLEAEYKPPVYPWSEKRAKSTVWPGDYSKIIENRINELAKRLLENVDQAEEQVVESKSSMPPYIDPRDERLDPYQKIDNLEARIKDGVIYLAPREMANVITQAKKEVDGDEFVLNRPFELIQPGLIEKVDYDEPSDYFKLVKKEEIEPRRPNRRHRIPKPPQLPRYEEPAEPESDEQSTEPTPRKRIKLEAAVEKVPAPETSSVVVKVKAPKSESPANFDRQSFRSEITDVVTPSTSSFEFKSPDISFPSNSNSQNQSAELLCVPSTSSAPASATSQLSIESQNLLSVSSGERTTLSPFEFVPPRRFVPSSDGSQPSIESLNRLSADALESQPLTPVNKQNTNAPTPQRSPGVAFGGNSPLRLKSISTKESRKRYLLEALNDGLQIKRAKSVEFSENEKPQIPRRRAGSFDGVLHDTNSNSSPEDVVHDILMEYAAENERMIEIVDNSDEDKTPVIVDCNYPCVVSKSKLLDPMALQHFETIDDTHPVIYRVTVDKKRDNEEDSPLYCYIGSQCNQTVLYYYEKDEQYFKGDLAFSKIRLISNNEIATRFKVCTVEAAFETDKVFLMKEQPLKIQYFASSHQFKSAKKAFKKQNEKENRDRAILDGMRFKLHIVKRLDTSKWFDLPSRIKSQLQQLSDKFVQITIGEKHDKYVREAVSETLFMHIERGFKIASRKLPSHKEASRPELLTDTIRYQYNDCFVAASFAINLITASFDRYNSWKRMGKYIVKKMGQFVEKFQANATKEFTIAVNAACCLQLYYLTHDSSALTAFFALFIVYTLYFGKNPKKSQMFLNTMVGAEVLKKFESVKDFESHVAASMTALFNLLQHANVKFDTDELFRQEVSPIYQPIRSPLSIDNGYGFLCQKTYDVVFNYPPEITPPESSKIIAMNVRCIDDTGLKYSVDTKTIQNWAFYVDGCIYLHPSVWRVAQLTNGVASLEFSVKKKGGGSYTFNMRSDFMKGVYFKTAYISVEEHGKEHVKTGFSKYGVDESDCPDFPPTVLITSE